MCTTWGNTCAADLVHGHHGISLVLLTTRYADDEVPVGDGAVVLVHSHQSRNRAAVVHREHEHLDFLGLVVVHRPRILGTGAQAIVLAVGAVTTEQLLARHIDVPLERVVELDFHTIIHIHQETDTLLDTFAEVDELALVGASLLDIAFDFID